MADSEHEIKGDGFSVKIFSSGTIATYGNVPKKIDAAIDSLTGLHLSNEGVKRAIEYEIKNLKKGHQ